MRKIQKNYEKRVLFNASVILSGIRSPNGGSAKLLHFVKQKQIIGTVSETIIDEALRNAYKIPKETAQIKQIIEHTFTHIHPAPKASLVSESDRLVTDAGDAHVLASCKETGADFLVTLDKKHLLALQRKIKWVRIVSPKELLENLAKK
ncbi:MAG: putative toxin-antitoxin system toxin component, PIN family [Patescibacteria group bacterium]